MVCTREKLRNSAGYTRRTENIADGATRGTYDRRRVTASTREGGEAAREL